MLKRVSFVGKFLGEGKIVGPAETVPIGRPTLPADLKVISLKGSLPLRYPEVKSPLPNITCISRMLFVMSFFLPSKMLSIVFL